MRFIANGEGEGKVVKRSDELLPAERDAVAVDKAALQRLTGNYAHQGMRMTVALEGEKLTTQLAGQPVFEIFAESPTKFFLKVVERRSNSSRAMHRRQRSPCQGGQVIEFKRE